MLVTLILITSLKRQQSDCATLRWPCDRRRRFLRAKLRKSVLKNSSVIACHFRCHKTFLSFKLFAFAFYHHDNFYNGEAIC